MGTAFLLVHGLGSRRPRAGWLSWLADELRGRGRRVAFPQLPDPGRPVLADWLTTLVDAYSGVGETGHVVVCHSLGCALWHEAATRSLLPNPAERVLFVAPPGRSVLREPVTAAFDPGPWDRAALDRASVQGTTLVCSDHDPYCREGAAAAYGHLSGTAPQTIPGAGHFGIADGYGRWPAVLDWCLDPTTILTAASPVSSSVDRPRSVGGSPDRSR